MGARRPKGERVIRIGIGYDIHRLASGRPLVIGGVTVPSPFGPEAHSDGDVVLHALIDALLGAAGLGDIGKHFSPSDERWRDAASKDLLNRTMELVYKAGLGVENVDATVVLEEPRLAEYLPVMVAQIAGALGITPAQVNVKAKTNEGLDAVGEGRALAAHAVVLLKEAPLTPPGAGQAHATNR